MRHIHIEDLRRMAESIAFVPSRTSTSSGTDDLVESAGRDEAVDQDAEIDAAVGERGSSLVAVMAVMTAVLLIGTALFFFGVAEHDLVTFQAEDTQAFYLAEAGLAHAKSYLDAKLDRGQYPGSKSFDDQSLGAGTYSVSMQNTGTSNPSYTEYDVISTGTVNGVQRRVHATISMETFGKYLWFVDNSNFLRWFTSNDRMDGLVHSNDWVRINGDPWFGDKVTTSRPYLVVLWWWSDPVFEKGYEVDCDEIPLPNRNHVRNAIRDAANSGGLSLGNLSGSEAHWEVVLGKDGNDGFLSYRSYNFHAGSYSYSAWTDVNIATLNGTLYSQKELWIEGTLDGRLTICGQTNIHVRDDLLYADSTPGSGPNPGCDDMLGVISRANIIIDRTTANESNCEIHGALMALGEAFEVEDPYSGSPRGDLIVYGSITQAEWGRICMFEIAGWIVHGYSRKYYYDTRMLTDAPPYYPQTGRYYVSRWDEELVS